MIHAATLPERFALWQEESHKSNDDFIVDVLARILTEASMQNVSDVHFQPGKNGVEIRFRIDGVLQILGRLPLENTAQIAARLKVLGDLLTYKVDVPQEGRVRAGRVPGVTKQMRISTTPTLYGERVVVRFFAEEEKYKYLDDIGFPGDIKQGVLSAIQKNSGAILVTGPAGSGKTTTAYAILREIADHGEATRSIVTLEDPIEHTLDGVSQTEITSQSEMTLDRMIPYLMRQDPEVILVGEIRDRATAQGAFQAALTGHLLVSTFHAGSAVEAIGRLFEMGLEPFVLRSSVSHLICQRLFRKLCSCAKKQTEPLVFRIGDEERTIREYADPRGCEKCGGTGYAGRILIAESLPLNKDGFSRLLLDRCDTTQLRKEALEHGMIPISSRVFSLLSEFATSPQEIRRILG